MSTTQEFLCADNDDADLLMNNVETKDQLSQWMAIDWKNQAKLD